MWVLYITCEHQVQVALKKELFLLVKHLSRSFTPLFFDGSGSDQSSRLHCFVSDRTCSMFFAWIRIVDRDVEIKYSHLLVLAKCLCSGRRGCSSFTTSMMVSSNCCWSGVHLPSQLVGRCTLSSWSSHCWWELPWRILQKRDLLKNRIEWLVLVHWWPCIYIQYHNQQCPPRNIVPDNLTLPLDRSGWLPQLHLSNSVS